MEKENLKNKILNVIEGQNISPKPKWQFLLKNYSVWVLGGLSVFVGGIASSLIIFVLMNGEWESYHYLSDSFFHHIVKIVPYLWIIVLMVFILGADYNFSHTKKGYKYSIPKIVGLSILASIILGLIFYQAGLAYITDYELGERVPGYHRFIEKRQELWSRPSEGLLLGTIISPPVNGIVILEDINGKKWKIETSRLNKIDFIILDEADMVSLVGYKKSKGVFDTCMIRPWKVEGESHYLREKLIKKAQEDGNEIYSLIGLGQDKLERMKAKIKQKNIDERNIFRMRNNGCERGTTSPTGPNY